jgi:hypothetical protein
MNPSAEVHIHSNEQERQWGEYILGMGVQQQTLMILWIKLGRFSASNAFFRAHIS